MRSLAISIALLSLAAGPALAEDPPCLPYETLASVLLSEAHETPVARMLDGRGAVLEILASPGGETYSLIVVQANGLACLVSVGEAFALVPPPPKGAAS